MLKPVIGPRNRKLLFLVFVLFALLAVNSVYLAGITFLEWAAGRVYQDYFYQLMFLLHLILGFVIILPVIIFGIVHIRNARRRPNRRAVHAGLALYFTAIALMFSGIILTRFEIFKINDPHIRSALYWVHALSPLAVTGLYLLHRWIGNRLRWRSGLRWAAFAGVFALFMLALHIQQTPRIEGSEYAKSERLFYPSLARTANGDYIPANSLMMQDYCEQCHEDITENWSHSAHRLSSFNNPAYLFSVRETRRVSMQQNGNTNVSRFCAGCHDPVPFFSGVLDDPQFDDRAHPTADAGITCTACHAITRINSPRGNADYTIAEPVHYPFAFAENPILQWLNRQLIKAKPEFHKKTFLKDFHRSAEFCGTCHKVHLPQEVNNYKWLRGQDHYDAYLLSGVSGHGITSFYYPPRAVHRCAQCHMPLMTSTDFGAQYFDASTELSVHDHMFAAANTALPHMLGLSEKGNEARRAFLSGIMRVDIFGIKEGGTIDGELHAPLRPEIPALVPGRRYLLEAVIRTLKLGHLFTQGTADSNEIWMEVTVSSGERIIGRSGGLNAQGAVDSWSHFVNAYVLDRHGNRIDRRNAQDIFVALYNHQIPPGAADVVHYQLDLPADISEPVTVEIKLQYRKFDTTYLKYIQGEAFVANDLPITPLAVDRVTFPLVGADAVEADQPQAVEEWVRWNDYGIGLLRKGGSGSVKGELRQAEFAFGRVEKLGHADGALNLARVYLKEGRLEDAGLALRRAAAQGALPWSVAWFSAQVNKQNGFLDEAIEQLRRIVATDFAQARRREFDFSQDYRVLNELGQTLFERAKRERGASRKASQEVLLQEAEDWFAKTLEIDPENVTAHYNLALIYARQGERERAREHRALHMKYRPDDNARERAVAIHRTKNPAADHAAEAVVIYDLRRSGAYGLSESDMLVASPEATPLTESSAVRLFSN